MDIVKVLTRNFQTSVWRLDGPDNHGPDWVPGYSDLTWLSEDDKPTEQELIDLWADTLAQDGWEAELAVYDALGITRTVEHIIDSMDPAQLARLDTVVQNRHAAKKEIRGRQP